MHGWGTAQLNTISGPIVQGRLREGSWLLQLAEINRDIETVLYNPEH